MSELLQFVALVVKTLTGDAAAIVTITALAFIVVIFMLYITNTQ